MTTLENSLLWVGIVLALGLISALWNAWAKHQQDVAVQTRKLLEEIGGNFSDSRPEIGISKDRSELLIVSNNAIEDRLNIDQIKSVELRIDGKIIKRTNRASAVQFADQIDFALVSKKLVRAGEDCNEHDRVRSIVLLIFTSIAPVGRAFHFLEEVEDDIEAEFDLIETGFSRSIEWFDKVSGLLQNKIPGLEPTE